ncbi:MULTISPECIES: 3-methyl-2-oxobutanoate hydroxymethyltransferase [Craterilacuibacter]|uniref:3-methyl-2-oxobutanoate hydroxymethyltransferase n=1 Tax=Craterilacuibacter sinensis TaxID=2686017 RepID=A0A845BJ21_9NEIS|nr:MULTISPECIES: 3-methyl-2-oxobutanoate hydroxymethyltransferase [Craterilacuibacter]MCL6262359.1 3-methyl-2-oxobutanoate hydroxymethyltransferase [Craterilacuibacter sp. RT1T]MCP9758667.1 3-methyl-2-oxobutanoate hydroxymethyltransferase [Aquitalea sp. S1-19]MXR36189.1 3-methyl-2-oxobutanoate hydroxymethyltransferase [Craterilacuibacter sinensis]RQW25472.1 3-methyl-2-oxobutanoate hydroxymethyltransferase [Rhodobacteraceae bacterium CH30]
MKVTVNTLNKMAAEGRKISMLTCYDASFASLLEDAGVDILLVGDSLGMVIQGVDSTLPVTQEEMEYHVRCVARGAKRALVLGDMTFGSYQQSPQQAFANASRLIQAGAHMVKIEGGAYMAETTRFLSERGIPVCAHIGLTPQFVNAFGGYRVQGKSEDDARRIVNDAKVLAEAGASMVLMECVPSALAREITETVAVPTIGIGAGVDVSGQVLVSYDALGVYPGKKARFVKNFMADAQSIQGAVEAYVKAVQDKSFPAAEHTF